MPSLPINIGGVLRCCIEAYDEWEGSEEEGAVIKCRWCSSSLIVRDGCWSWNNPDETHPSGASATP